MGIRDPDLAATVCPHPGCTTKAPNAKAGTRKDATTTAPTTAFNSTFSKAVLETERRIGEAGPGGDLALSKQDQQTVKEMKDLQDMIATMKDLQTKSGSGTDFSSGIATRELELQKLKNNLPIQEAQQALMLCCCLSVRGFGQHALEQCAKFHGFGAF